MTTSSQYAGRRDMVYAHVQIRKVETEPSSRTELRRIYRLNGVETVLFQNLRYEIYVDPKSLDVYFLILGTGKK